MYLIIKIHSFSDNKASIREKALNEDNDAEFLFAKLKPEGANRRCENRDLLEWTLKDDT